MKMHYEKTIELHCTDTDKELIAEVDHFKEKIHLDAYIANNRIRMKWNGKVYVGNSAGFEFTSDGPIMHFEKQGRV